MKKILLFVVSVLVAATMFAQGATKCEIQCLDPNASMERGSRSASEWGTFTNFTATDMNGVSHNIQNYLNEGKYVVIDFFCAWCGPCWSYHQSGILENLHNTYGPAGSGEFVALMVECETSNTAAQITGTHTANTYAGASQGDFTNGGENPVPIIDATSNLAGKVSLYEGYVPSVYLFCPSGYVYYINSFNSAAAIYNFAVASCPVAADVPQVDMIEPDVVQLNQSAQFKSYVVSVSNVTYEWSFEGATPATATTATVNNVVWDEVGPHVVTLTVTNENGSANASTTINVVDCSAGVTEYPIIQNFEMGRGCWTYSSKNTANQDELGVYEYSDGMHGFRFSSYSSASNYNQYLISPLLEHNGELDLSFRYKLYSTNYQERFKILYSTTTNAVTSFTEVSGTTTNVTSSSFQTFNCTVPAEAKYLAINYCPAGDRWWLIIDDVRIEANHEDPTSIEGAIDNEINIFPNPTTGIVNIEAEGLNKVVVYDVTGREVKSFGAESTIDISDLDAGVYFFSIETANASSMKKLVKE